MKPHRQIRSSKRVSSETGTAVMDIERKPGRFETCMNELERLLKPFAPVERRSIIAALAEKVMKEANTHE